MRYFICFFAILISFLYFSCKKKIDDPCADKVQPTASFELRETLTDTAFEADTVFRDNYVQLVATSDYQSVSWKLGSDPRDWTKPDFTLSFHQALGTIPITFTGLNTPNTLCFPSDNGVYKATKPLTMVEQVDKATLTLSPLIGRYKGAFETTPNDVFVVRIEYFDSAKYDVQVTGSKNFYWISNMPDGVKGTSVIYPELQNGVDIEMGYKCFQFGDSTLR